MRPRCNICGRYMKRLREEVDGWHSLPTPVLGMPLITGSPPDRPSTAGSVPSALFVCFNPAHDLGIGAGRVQYEPVGFATLSQPPQRPEPCEPP